MTKILQSKSVVNSLHILFSFLLLSRTETVSPSRPKPTWTVRIAWHVSYLPLRPELQGESSVVSPALGFYH